MGFSLAVVTKSRIRPYPQASLEHICNLMKIRITRNARITVTMPGSGSCCLFSYLCMFSRCTLNTQPVHFCVHRSHTCWTFVEWSSLWQWGNRISTKQDRGWTPDVLAPETRPSSFLGYMAFPRAFSFQMRLSRWSVTVIGWYSSENAAHCAA